MVRVVGIDPGTRSMDVCALKDGKPYFERVVDTARVAAEPGLLVEAVSEAMPADLVVGPSGYGVELTYLKDIPLTLLRDWYYQYILLTRRESIEEALRRKVFGALIYYAMAESAVEMKRRAWPVVYVPGVVHLPTVPEHRKVNKVDMGTVDKMCVAILGIRDQAERLSIPYSEVSFVQVEMGFGYNAVLGVQGGGIVDGIGGTTMPGPGFLTLGSMDAELAPLGGTWDKADVFAGGSATISGVLDPESMLKNLEADPKCALAWEAMLEGVHKGVLSMGASVPKPKEILISGRIVRIPRVEKVLKEKLGSIAPVRKVSGLRGVKDVKETAQGYALVGDGLAGGKFRELIDWVKVRGARGTAMDHLYHPKVARVREGLVPFRPGSS